MEPGGGGGGGGTDTHAESVNVHAYGAYPTFAKQLAQQKKVKEHKAIVAALRRGDQVVTQGGIIGKVSKVKDDAEVEVEIAEGVKVRIVRATITQVLSKTDPSA